ncbi:MAG: PQQ-like beta-propeller repeat protein [Planctomycetales bacterium]
MHTTNEDAEMNISPGSNFSRASVVCWAAGAWLAAAAGLFAAEDWPQFLGPSRNGVYQGKVLPVAWKKSPPVVWKRAVGQGYSGPVATDGKVILFHREKNQEVVECMAGDTGKTLWKTESPTAYRSSFGFGEGPRATPCVKDGRVYVHGAEGVLQCLELETGKRVWSVDTVKKFKIPKGFFGLACSPLVENGKVLMNNGGSEEAGAVAFDAKTGKTAWTAGTDPASYSSGVLATIQGKPHLVFFTRTGLLDLDPSNGKILHQMRWRARINASVNAATPLVVDDMIFLTTSYRTGAVLLKPDGDSLNTVWSNDDSMSCHYNTCVHRDGFLYGIHGRQEYGPSLRCVELKTGKVRWSEEKYRAGFMTLVGDNLLMLRDDGELVLAAASPEKYQPLAASNILSGVVRAPSAYAGGYFLARNEDTLVCVKLGE